MKLLKNKKFIIFFVLMFIVVGSLILLNMNRKDEVSSGQNVIVESLSENENILGWEKGKWWKIELMQYAPWKYKPTWTPAVKIIFEVREINKEANEAKVVVSYENLEEVGEINKNDSTSLFYDLSEFKLKKAATIIQGKEYEFSEAEIPELLPYYSLYSVDRGLISNGEEKDFVSESGRFKGNKVPSKKVKLNEGEFQTWSMDNSMPFWVFYESPSYKATLIDKSN